MQIRNKIVLVLQVFLIRKMSIILDVGCVVAACFLHHKHTTMESMTSQSNALRPKKDSHVEV